MPKLKLGFLGAGNMASAIIRGVTGGGLLDAAQIGLYDISAEKLETFRAGGFFCCGSVAELVRACDTIVIAVKPQNFPQVLPEIKAAITRDKLLISIAAGISAATIRQAMGFDCKLVLAMPNTPLLLGCGATALCRIEPVTEEEFAFARSIFASAGIAEEISQEHMNDIIPVNASSPAFVYLFAKAVIDSAAKAGIGPETAARRFCQTLTGSAKMMMESDKTPQELIDMVCSPGGTTLAAMKALDDNGFTGAVETAFSACVERARELGNRNQDAGSGKQ